MKDKKFSLASRIKSFKYAFEGLFRLFRDEPNAQIHALAVICVVSLGVLLKLDRLEWFVVILCIVAVISLEAINTAIERLCDEVAPEKKDSIKYIKDVSSAAVLLAAIASLIIGLLIFIPRIERFLE